MHDMDETDDVKALAERLCRAISGEINEVELERRKDCLLQSSGLSRMPPTTGKSEHTWNTLMALALIERTSGDGESDPKYHIRQDAFAPK